MSKLDTTIQKLISKLPNPKWPDYLNIDVINVGTKYIPTSQLCFFIDVFDLPAFKDDEPVISRLELLNEIFAFLRTLSGRIVQIECIWVFEFNDRRYGYLIGFENEDDASLFVLHYS